MKRLFLALLAVILVLAGSKAVRADIILSSGLNWSGDSINFAGAYHVAEDYPATPSSTLYIYNYLYPSIGTATPTSATVNLSDSAPPPSTPGLTFSLSSGATNMLFPSTSNFSSVMGTGTATSSVSLLNDTYAGGYVDNEGETSVGFTLTSPYSYTLTFQLPTDPTAVASSAADGTSGADAQSGGSFGLVKSDFSFYAYGNATVSDTSTNGSPSSPSFGGYVLSSSSFSFGYNPSVVLTGVLDPGDYSYFAYATQSLDAYGYNASASGSVSMAISLTLTSADTTATPEPASLTMLGIGLASMAGYGWRRRKQVS